MEPQRRQHRRHGPLLAGVVDVGPGTVWADPVRRGRDPQADVDWYRTWLREHPVGRELAERARNELPGSDLSCTCALDEPCHADVLLDVANTPETRADQS